MFICKDLRVAAVEVSDSLVHRMQTTKKKIHRIYPLCTEPLVYSSMFICFNAFVYV